MAKVLVATEKPFAKEAVEGIKEIFASEGIEVSLLEKYTDKKQLLDSIKDVDGVIVRSDIIDKEVFDSAKNLKVVARAGAGYDSIDLDEATKHGVVVMNTPGQNANAVAELVFGMLVFSIRNCFNGKSGTELKGKKLGLLAYGNTGRNVARVAKGFGMEVSAFDPFTPKDVMEKEGVRYVDNQDELFQSSDVISMHIPATSETKGSIGMKYVSMMPKGAILVNTARKEIIDEKGLLECLKERTDLRYLTDIKPDMDEQFKEVLGERYFSTPKKMGAQTAEANINAGLAAARQISDLIIRGIEKFKVNK